MSNALQRDLAKIVAAVDERAAREGHGRYAQRFHLMPPTGWMNDPNGLCQKDGVFHAYFQYAPFDVNGGVKCWGHAESRDLMHWEYQGAPLLPDEPFDVHGVYSGSAVVQNGRMHVLYTGNVKLPDADGAFDYINAGRRADTILVESEDGRTFGEKRVVIPSEAYPEDLTCHVRDPFVWRADDGRYLMLLGARRRLEGPMRPSRFASIHGEGAGRDVGEVLVYASRDFKTWELVNRVSSDERFGFMWECPGYAKLPDRQGRERQLLSVSPQGLEGEEWERRNIYQAGYFDFEGAIDGNYALGDFHLWDAGFDFYAPQVFVAEDGRRILIGWMGIPDEPSYGNDPTVEVGWQHCTTIPRELSVADDGAVLQQPVREIESLRGEYASTRTSYHQDRFEHFDVTVSDIDDEFAMLIDGGLMLAFKPAEDNLPARFEMRFVDDSREGIGCGRQARWEPAERLDNVRVVADTSSVEVFVNDGSLVMTTRIYPKRYAVSVSAPCARIECWELA